MLNENEINRFINIYQLAKTFLEVGERDHCCACSDYYIKQCPICLAMPSKDDRYWWVMRLYPEPWREEGKGHAFCCDKCKAEGTIVEFIEMARKLTKEEAIAWINEAITKG